MALELHGGGARLTDVVTVEDAEPLAAWLAGHRDAPVDVDGLLALHAAALQALLAARASLRGTPADPFLAELLPALLPAPEMP